MILVHILAALVGVSLGLLGAGGSILAVPILRYAGGLSAKHAVATSLATVGAVALIGALLAWREQRVRLQDGLSFAAIASVGTLMGVRLSALLSDSLQMGLFLLVMASALLATRRSASPATPSRVSSAQRARADKEGLSQAEGSSLTSHNPSWPSIVLKAVGVGILTGLVGVGGGFLIVPALMAIYRMPIRDATGTSLLVIAFNSALGVTAYSGTLDLDLAFTLTFVSAAVTGLLAGLAAGKRVGARTTESLFQGFILLVGLYTLWREASTWAF